ncbi:MAG TPA: Hpt domain-containing protein [Vicinamibacteria bacterium]|nr:Hpt domain-containing protein [Vicinamibacteria bacterium]
MSSPPPPHSEEFEAQRRAYLAELSEKLGALQASAAALVRDGWDRSALESLYHQAHRIAGSSGVYGLDGLSHASSVLAERVKALLDSSTWPPTSSPRELATVVAAVKQAGRPRS